MQFFFVLFLLIIYHNFGISVSQLFTNLFSSLTLTNSEFNKQTKFYVWVIYSDKLFVSWLPKCMWRQIETQNNYPAYRSQLTYEQTYSPCSVKVKYYSKHNALQAFCKVLLNQTIQWLEYSCRNKNSQDLKIWKTGSPGFAGTRH